METSGKPGILEIREASHPIHMTHVKIRKQVFNFCVVLTLVSNDKVL